MARRSVRWLSPWRYSGLCARRQVPSGESCLPRVSCPPASAFTGQAFHRLATGVTEEQLEKAQIEIARAAVELFDLSTCVLAFDTTNFDTHLATTTARELARRGHAKSKRSDLRAVGLATLVSETGRAPLLHRAYAGNGPDQAVLGSWSRVVVCLLEESADRVESLAAAKPW